ncbi:MAG: tripartite tricarboxylate transporter permease, partial [Pseudomonadales bacterium]
MLEGLMIGAGTAFSGFNLLLIAAGCLSGMLIGMLPGLGPISAIALLIPVSYALAPESGIMMLAGVYYGAIFGGSTSSILLNAPGVAGTVATAFDGYPMAREGQPGKALAIAAYASFIGGTVGVMLLMVLAPQLAEFALAFQSPEYFMLMVLGLSLVFAFAEEGDHLKALAMVLLGLSLATVGTDRASGLPRFTFGSMELMDGISFLVLAMGTFAMTEAVYMAASFGLRSLALGRATTSTMAPAVGRGSILGFFVGTLPGAGATMASFLAYGLEKTFPKPSETPMGRGNARGLAAPEAANNAACT